MKPTLADLERLVVDAETAPPENAVSAWAELAALEADPLIANTAEGAYLLGYANYQVGLNAPGHLDRATQLFRAALMFEPNHLYARLYLGHVAFDQGLYVEALSHFDQLESQAFSKVGQGWRDLKRQELRICCLLHLNSVRNLVFEFEKFLELASEVGAAGRLSVHELPSLMQSAFGLSRHDA